MESERFEAFLERVTTVRRYKRQAREAPHKPLVLLCALAAAAAGRRLITFSEVEQALSPIIRQHWNTSPRVEQPFVRLAHDGFWQLSRPEADLLTPSGAISLSALRSGSVLAGFDDATFKLLTGRPERLSWATRIMLFEVASSDVQLSITDALVLPL